MGFLAYVFNRKEPQEVVDTRTVYAERHLMRLYRGPVTRTDVGDGGSGFVGWTPEQNQVQWRPYLRRGAAGIAWLHVPSLAGGPESGVDEWTLAQDLFAGRLAPAQIGSPFAVIRWENGRLEIINDLLGLVRLFHFPFEGGDIWTTRPGLAHVFMGVQPAKNRLAWSGMATLGWATSGSTQLGKGKQLQGGSRISGGYRGKQRFLEMENCFPAWLHAARIAAEPSATTSVRDMELYMSTAKRWPKDGVSDLSGGKDSRVVAAIGIRSGAVKTVRTVATDHGEVETAQLLMSLIDADVEHQIVPRKDPSMPGGSFVARVGSQHVAWEGRYLSTTAYNSATFTGFSPADAPTFNGLGGEVMAGGNLLGAWYERLINAAGPVAMDKLATMVNVALGASAEAKELATADIQTYVARAQDMGIDGAAGVMDIFYHLDKMPHWSITYATPNTITPLFAPSLLVFAAQRTGRPLEYGEAHRRLLRAAIPEWGDVPFYKPTAAKRAMPFIWENRDWEEVRSFILDRLDRADSFDPDVLLSTLSRVSEGDAGKREEILMQRFIWELTFDDYLGALEREVQEAAAAIRNVQRTAGRTLLDRAKERVRAGMASGRSGFSRV